MTPKTKIITSSIVLVVIFLLLVASSLTGNVVKEQTIKIGFIGPLSGDVSSLGQNAKIGVEMAVEEINSNGGINGKQIEVIYEDTKCNAKEAVNAGNKLINVDNVNAIIGGLCSSETISVAPIAEQSKTPLISYCSSAPGISSAGDYTFRVYPSDSFQGKYLAEYLYNVEGKRKVSILYCLADYCLGVKEQFEKRFKELGGEILVQEASDSTTKDFKAELTKVSKSNSDAIFIAHYTEANLVFFRQYKELGLAVPIYSTEVLDDPVVSNSNIVPDGTKYSLIASASTEFQELLNSRTGKETTSLCASQAYDAVKLIEIAIMKAGIDSENIKNELYNIKDFQGSSGVIGFDNNGDLLSANYQVKIFSNGKSEVLN